MFMITRDRFLCSYPTGFFSCLVINVYRVSLVLAPHFHVVKGKNTACIRLFQDISSDKLSINLPLICKNYPNLQKVIFIKKIITVNYLNTHPSSHIISS